MPPSERFPSTVGLPLQTPREPAPCSNRLDGVSLSWLAMDLSEAIVARRLHIQPGYGRLQGKPSRRTRRNWETAARDRIPGFGFLAPDATIRRCRRVSVQPKQYR